VQLCLNHHPPSGCRAWCVAGARGGVLVFSLEPPRERAPLILDFSTWLMFSDLAEVTARPSSHAPVVMTCRSAALPRNGSHPRHLARNPGLLRSAVAGQFRTASLFLPRQLRISMRSLPNGMNTGSMIITPTAPSKSGVNFCQ